MKISLVTWLGNGNYGTALQSYALYQKLKLLGYDTSFLPYFDGHFRLKSILKGILAVVGILQLRDKNKLEETKALKKLYAFQKEKYEICHIYFRKQYKKLLNQTDVFVTGSDQIWNAWYSFNPFYFLDFAKDKKRIAYASSIGANDFPEKYKNEIKKLLSSFTHIGVRELTAVKTISSLLKRNDIVQVLDPTFLLEPHEWNQLAKEADVELKLPSKYILCYLIGNNPHYKKQLLNVAKEYGIKDIIIIPAAENKSFHAPDSTVYENAGPKEFVYLIQHAALVCTDSFHATAISINLSINFVEFLRFKDTDKESQNSRIYDILNHYNLHSRLYSSNTDVWLKEIDYTPVQAILAEDRIKSVKYLINSIEH